MKKCIGEKLINNPLAAFSTFIGFFIIIISLGAMFIGWEFDWLFVRGAILGALMYVVPTFYFGLVEWKNENS